MNLENVLKVIDDEDELPKSPMESLGLLKALVVMYRMVFYPVRSQRTFIVMTKRSIRRRMIAEWNKQKEEQRG